MQARVADRLLGGLSVRVHYPVAAGAPAAAHAPARAAGAPVEAEAALPVVVFSHGLGGSRLGYGFLGRAWAEHGYLSLHPSHRENVPFGAAEAERPSLSTLRAMKEAIDDPRNWEARPRDVATVIDSLSGLQLPALAGKLDASRIAVAGHSYGAYTALLCAGAGIRLDGATSDFRERRAQAFIALSPPGNGSRGLEAASWAAITAPVLCVTGTEDRGFQGQPPEWREESFRALPPPEKTLVVVDGAEHFTFSGGRPRLPADPAHLRDIVAATLWFLDRHLKGDPRAFPLLAGSRVERK